ncbi:xanthine dehydrogenase accessory protein XdhC [Salipiger sp. IMCC34102]|uniref:xanthine dehydrogenase accessory protein XdhC n=1 Tax=Salipiger sp. IMCC34102 TaxID=2510647 RepID=UPI00101B6282|nr:xanthine dehydrogenase accessory protein XdhC [Salipiger sp. IMCC34102]RYH01404.1 xanthine dehydrogenase accessory protein XdhC [Salipiger sp. IMCC34102]
MSGIRVILARTSGSVPREAGTQMWVGADRTEGTIGGGALEWQAIKRARAMLALGAGPATETVPLGPALGQCCGGSVTLEFAPAEGLERAPGAPLWIWGAGHVGRALARVMAPLPEWDVTLIDDAADRMPPPMEHVTPLVAADMPRALTHAPDDAHHLIVTYSHAIDLDLCHAILSRSFAGAGLIGSATKWARFRGRLQALGHAPAQIARIACPIGDPSLGKHPQAIAIGVAVAMMARTTQQETRRA